jgi:hypothetical protein
MRSFAMGQRVAWSKPVPIADAKTIQSLFNLLGRGPKALEDMASILFGSKASVVLTNVIGPHEKRRLAGEPGQRGPENPPGAFVDA